MRENNSRMAFVFAGGGSLGAVQVGMLKALVPYGLEPDFVVGSSVGAINAAYFLGEDARDAVKGLDTIWRNIRRKDVFPVSPRRAILGLLARRSYTVSSASLEFLIEEHLKYERVENSRIPLHIVTTDVLSGSEFVISSGPVVEALLASAAVPGVFPPVLIGRQYLMDGGVANNSPISVAVALGAKRIIVLPTVISCILSKSPRSAIGMVLHALNIFMVKQLAVDVELFGKQAEIVIVPPLDPAATLAHDFSYAAEMIDRSERQTLEWIQANRERLLSW